MHATLCTLLKENSQHYYTNLASLCNHKCHFITHQCGYTLLACLEAIHYWFMIISTLSDSIKNKNEYFDENIGVLSLSAVSF